jgi:hypothetical protein
LVDGQPAGVAPVYPWIYTGGIDPFLWEPIPGVQTLDFKPYRVDLTPFAGLLSDGNSHTVSVGVFNANSFFLATANLLAFTDRNKQQVTGGIISNTLSAAPTPVVTENITSNPGGAFTGSVSVASNRKFAIRGFVNTSHGRVETTVEQTVAFLSNQQFNVGPTTDLQNAQQTSTVDSVTTTRDAFFVKTTEQHFSYPLTVDFSFLVNSDGSQTQTTTVSQKDLISESKSLNGFKFYESNLSNQLSSTDTLPFNSSGALLGPTGSKTTQTYSANDSLGHCFSRTLTASAQVLTSVEDGSDCKPDHNGR